MKAIKITFIVLFFAILIIPVALIDTTPAKISKAENRYLKDFPTLNDHAKYGIKGRALRFAWDLEEYIKDRIGFRQRIVEGWAIAKVYLGIAKGKQYTLGKEGWTYLNYFNYNYLNNGGKEKIVSAHSKIKDYYEKQGIDYFYLIPPAKSEIYPEYLPDSFTPDMVPNTDDLVGMLSVAGINAVNPKEKIIEYKSVGKTYSAGDHHWAGLGSYASYLALVDSLNENGYSIKPLEVEFVEERSILDGGIGMFGLPGILHKGRFIDDMVINAKWNKSGKLADLENVEEDIIKKLYEYGNAEKLVGYFGIIENPDAPYGTAILYGDSFASAKFEFPWYLSENFKKVVYIVNYDSSKIQPELENYIKPDVVIYESFANNYAYNRAEIAGDLLNL